MPYAADDTHQTCLNNRPTGNSNSDNPATNATIQAILMNVNETHAQHSMTSLTASDSDVSLKIADEVHASSVIESPAEVTASGPPVMLHRGSLMCRICHNSDRLDR